jgi:hypothetical protein
MDFSRYHALRRVVAAVTIVLCVASPAFADGNPGYDRPGLGFTPAVLHTGDVTWEQGLPDWNRADDGSSQYTADTLLRLGIGGPLELQLGTSYNRLHPTSMGSGASYGRGDSSVALKFALPAAGAFSWGLLGSVEFNDGARNFRGDRRQYLLGAAFNWQLDTRHALGMYLQNVRAGGRNSPLLALNASHALTATLNGYVEVVQQHDVDTGNGSMAGAGLAWQVTPRVQLDGSFRHRLAGHADSWEAGFGVSMYFGR